MIYEDIWYRCRSSSNESTWTGMLEPFVVTLSFRGCCWLFVPSVSLSFSERLSPSSELASTRFLFLEPPFPGVSVLCLECPAWAYLKKSSSLGRPLDEAAFLVGGRFGTFYGNIREETDIYQRTDIEEVYIIGESSFVKLGSSSR